MKRPSPYAHPDRYIPPENIKKAKGTAKYIKHPQCAAQYRNGNRAGQRCGRYSKEGSIYCKKHGTNEGKTNSPEHIAAIRAGHANWWARMHAIEAARPGFLREVFQRKNEIVSANYKARWAKQRALGIKSPILLASDEILSLAKPQTDDPKVMKAHKKIAGELVMLPDDPPKPFEDMTDAEQFVVLRRTALTRAHEVLLLPIRNERGEILPKMVSVVKDAALRTLTLGVKIDQGALAAQQADKMADLLLRLKGEPLKVIEG